VAATTLNSSALLIDLMPTSINSLTTVD